MTAWIAGTLAAQGRRPGILMRGYRGRVDEAEPRKADAPRLDSDEAEVLRRHCPEARVVIDADRVAGAAIAISEGCNVLVLDDGFQHRRLRRDLDIVLIDARCPFGFERLLPRGLLREPIRSLRRAHAAVITRCDAVSVEERTQIETRVRGISPRLPVIRARHVIADYCDIRGRPVADFDPGAAQAAVFAGIADFGAFRDTLQRLGVRVVGERIFRDHHDYTNAEIAALPHWAAGLEANAVLTTEKDAVKLVERWPSESLPLIVPRVRIAFEGDGAEVLTGMLGAALGRTGEAAARPPTNV